ncbi:MAG: TonB-dependent receptor [Sphingomonadales bacterium]|nr:TonB-dependent receptor [Sphingomonadales bacterium]
MTGRFSARRNRARLAALLTGIALIPAPALAQGAAPDAAVADSDSGGEIVVTALRRESSILQTPAAVTAIGGNQLRDSQVTNLTDVASAVPSLNIGEAAGVSLVTMRGISLDAIIGGIESSIAIHRDGVYLSQATPMNFLLMDVGDIQVLRGPQGTLYGRNATGGAINITPARASRHLTGYVNFSAGNLGTYREEAAVSGPIVADKLLFRIAGLAEQRTDGYARNVFNGAKLGTSYEQGARAALEFLPSDDATIRVEGYYFSGRNTSDFWTNIEPFSASQLALNPDFANHAISYDPRRPSLDFTPEDTQTSKGVNLSSSWNLGSGLSLETKTSFTDLAYARKHADCDGTAIPTCDSNRADRSRSFQQEVSVKLKSDRVKGVAGAFYDTDLANARQVFPWFNPAQGYVNVDGFPLPNGTQTEQISRQRTNSLAFFADADFAVAPWISLYGGARYSHDKRAMDLTSGLGLTGNDAILLGCTDLHQEVAYSNFSGKAGAQIRPNASSQFYGQWQQGFKAGGFNTAACGASFKPEKITAYEVGYKASLFDRAVDLALAAFHYDYTNLQTAQIIGVSYSITNAASAKIDGIEGEITMRPATGLQIDGHASLLDARYGDYSNFDPINPSAGMQDLSGKRLNRAPRFSGAVGLQYTAPIGSGEFKLRGEMTFTSKYYFRPYNQPLDSQAGFVTGNGYITYTLDNGLELRGFVRNIADKRIIAGIFTTDIGQSRQAQFQPPRTYGFGFGFHY